MSSHILNEHEQLRLARTPIHILLIKPKYTNYQTKPTGQEEYLFTHNLCRHTKDFNHDQTQITNDQYMIVDANY